jgi:lipopolysaccharide export system protein LptA
MQRNTMLSNKKLILSAIFAILFMSCITAIAQEDSDAPIHIEADRMISQEDANSVVFIGNVDARQGDVTIRSDEMTVYYTQQKNSSGKKSSSQVHRLICKKNVEVVQDDWLGTGNRMDYFAKDRKVILTGNAKAWQGQNMVTGKTITYYLDEKRSIVEQDQSKPGRVKAVLHPDSDKKK